MSPARLLALAERAARRAGKALAASAPARVEKDSARDVKLDADRASEARILKDLSPSGLPALSEEKGQVGKPRPDGLRWVVDPLDGSYNHLRGIPLRCVSIGLMKNDEPILGVIYDVDRGELFSGVVGRGLRVNGRSARVSRARPASRAVLLTGLPSGGGFSPARLSVLAQEMRRWRKVRLLGTAALSLAWVAAGRADAYREQGILLWDVAAGLALVKAAGGKYELKRGLAGKGLRVYAHNGRL